MKGDEELRVEGRGVGSEELVNRIVFFHGGGLLVGRAVGLGLDDWVALMVLLPGSSRENGPGSRVVQFRC